MPILPGGYEPPFWARQAHVNTIWAAKCRRVRYPGAEQRGRVRRIRLETPDGDFDARAVDIAPNGGLVVSTAEGEKIITAGEVVHIR